MFSCRTRYVARCLVTQERDGRIVSNFHITMEMSLSNYCTGYPSKKLIRGGESMHVESSLPALRSKAGRVHPPPEGYKRKKN